MEEQKVLQLAPEEIRPQPAQPRRTFSREELESLAGSIRSHGVLQPLTVRRTGDRLGAGGGRASAAGCGAGGTGDGALSGTNGGQPCLPRRWLWWKTCSGRTCTIWRRRRLSPPLSPARGLTQEAAAEQLAMSPSALANKLRLLRLSPACRAVVTEGRLTERHARCLLRLEDEGERLSAARHFVSAGLNVAQAGGMERRLEALQSTPPRGAAGPPIIKDVRLFLNSVDRGIRLIRDAGVDARTGGRRRREDIILTIHIPKRREKRA